MSSGFTAAGMATFNPNRGKILANYKEIGTVIEAFRMNDPAKYASIMEDYATTGRAPKGKRIYGALFTGYQVPTELPQTTSRKEQS